VSRESSGRRLGRIALRVVLLLVVFSAGFAYGDYAAKHRVFPYPHISTVARSIRGFLKPGRPHPQGRWGPAAGRAKRSALTAEQEEELVRMMTLGYVRGTKPATSLGGVTVFIRDRVQPGLNLYTSGHAPEALLIDMEGLALHRWGARLTDVWPEREWDIDEPEGQLWRRVHLFENGDLLAIYDWLGLVKVDRDSRVLWARAEGAHHDLDVLEDGTIYVLEHEKTMIPRLSEEHPVVEDFISILSPNGVTLRRVSLVQALERSDYWPILANAPPWPDILHTNSLEVLDGRLEHLSPAFAAGNVLVSFREIDTIAVVDMKEEIVAWALVGRWHRQHDASILESGSMMLFDNESGGGFSEVIELDPFTQREIWSVGGDSTRPFFSGACGAAQRLPNGNTLVTESDNGRAFEVTPEGALVWEFENPHRAGTDLELIATIYEMKRLPPDFPTDWIPASEEGR
jgi:hypothetical protein